MSSPYATLGGRSLDQWRVTELKEELKRRKLTTKGLKEDLVKRLDEVLRTESASTNGLPVLPSEQAKEDTSVLQKAYDFTGNAMETIGNVPLKAGNDDTDGEGSFVEGKVLGFDLIQENDGVQAEAVAHVNAKEETLLAKDAVKSGNSLSDVQHNDAVKSGNSLSDEQHNDVVSAALPHLQELPPSDQGVSEIQPFEYQVSAVKSDSGIEVTSNSVSNESISVTEKNEINVDIIIDNNKLELDVKPEQSSLSSAVLDSVNVPEKVDDAELVKSIDSADFVSEKLNLDRSSGDDSMEEDMLDVKKLDAEPGLSKGVDSLPSQLEDDHVDVVGPSVATEAKSSGLEQKIESDFPSVKRKLHEPTLNDDPAKKARRWNTGDTKISELQTGNAASITAPTGSHGSSFKRFSVSNHVAIDADTPKERIVPPSSKPPTNSLRIDQFLRPFTNKAVQELLGRTGTVTSFWMDQIKTHCYVSYSSVEEAEKTRDAVYNIQWPPNGGRLLIAEFVDPQDVKSHLEGPPPSAAANATPTYQHAPGAFPKPTPHHDIQKQRPPLSAFPPPLLPSREHPLPSREHQARVQPLPGIEQLNLPPPPPLPENVDPPIPTLDDFFRKTKSSPRIYYLPLSDEQVAVKIQASGKTSSIRH